MNKMQKEYMMKWLKGLAVAGWIVLCLISAIMGEPWLWFAIGSMVVVCVPIAFAMIYIPIATQVWYWRLMGICEEEWQSDLLARWWFWMRRCENWFSSLATDIYEDWTEENQEEKQKQLDFLYALNRVKKPKLL